MSANPTTPHTTVANDRALTTADEEQPAQLVPCACRFVLVDGEYSGCTRVTKRTFAPGHDAQLKSRLITAAVAGATVEHLDGWGTGNKPVVSPSSVAEEAGRHGFGYLVAAGVVRAQRQATEKADRKAARDAVREANAATRAAAKQQAAAKREAKKAAKTADTKPVQAKVGRWTYPGTVAKDGTFVYVTNSGQAKKAKEGSYTLLGA